MTERPELEIELRPDQLRERARAALGFHDSSVPAPPVRATLREHGLGLYPLTMISTLAVVDSLHGWGFVVLAPEISHSFGLSVGVIAGVLTAKNLMVALAPLVAAALANRPRRALLTVANAIGWSVAGIATAFTANVWGLLGVSAVDGATSGASHALHTPLLMDAHPAAIRVRVLTIYQIGMSAANVIAPLLVAVLTGMLHYSWRGVFLVTGIVSLGAALCGVRLRDPGFGTFDDQQVRAKVRSTGDRGDDIGAEDVELGTFEIFRRLLLIPTIRRLLIGNGIIGVLAAPFLTFLFFFLDERWGMGPGARGVFLAGSFAASIAVLTIFGRRGEALFHRDPGRLVELSGIFLVAAVVVVSIAAVMPVFAVMCILFGLAQGLVAMLTPSLNITSQSVIPSRMRPHQAALTGIAMAVGGILGLIFFTGIERRFGIAGSLVALSIPGILAAIVIASAGRLVAPDLDRMVDGLLEDEELRRRADAGERPPMLSCRGVDFSYGRVQVLFGVDFTVDDGEMVALLGVNGAGKSTLLKAISGIGLPSNGTIRYRGHDITHLDAERRVHLGITQVPGGRAVFGPVSVIDNLRAYGHALGRDRHALDTAIEQCFLTFPKLAERRNQAASTLSGGEQQMLALSKALVLRPRLLLIDELSLGLAPIIVGQLLDLVRQINHAGTAVVLVEQSVNVALDLVDHAYFMEKGEIRFDGPSDDLLGRGDLLRAVFLSGSAAVTT